MKQICLDELDISKERGFLPKQNPLTRLPDYYEPWEEITALLPKILLAGQVRSMIEALPQLSTDILQGEQEVQRAMLLLSYLGHAYVWGMPNSAEVLPKNIAVPWYEVAKGLGRPLSYCPMPHMLCTIGDC